MAKNKHADTVDVTVQVNSELYNQLEQSGRIPADFIEENVNDIIKNTLQQDKDEINDVNQYKASEHAEIVVKLPIAFKKLDAWLSERCSTSLKIVLNKFFAGYIENEDLLERLSAIVSPENEPYKHGDEIAEILGIADALNKKFEEGINLARVTKPGTITVSIPAKLENIRDLVQQYLGKNLEGYLQEQLENTIDPENVAGYVMVDLYEEKGETFESMKAYIIKIEAFEQALGLPFKPEDFDDFTNHLEVGTCSKCGKYGHLGVFQHFVHGQLIETVCENCRKQKPDITNAVR